MENCREQLRCDCEQLMSRFQETDSVRFEVFSRIWRQMKFGQIFYGTRNHEKRVFSRLVLEVAYGYFLPPFSFQIRVGGLYLLHSLFHCQIASPPEPIRLALKDWKDVKKFEKDAQDAQHLDVIFILHQLMFHKAFHFTAMPNKLMFQKKRKAEPLSLCEGFIERPCRPQELITMELMEEMSNIHNLYEKLKGSVSLTSEQMNSSVNLIRKDLVPQLQGAVMGFYKWQHRKDGMVEAEDSGEGTSSQQECSRRADLVAAIKSKAYRTAAEAPKSRRHRQVEVDFTSSEAGAAPTSQQSSKLSLKARTIENVHVTGDLCKEATKSTYISCLTKLESAPEEKTKPPSS